jgi:hypothetical protein
MPLRGCSLRARQLPADNQQTLQIRILMLLRQYVPKLTILLQLQLIEEVLSQAMSRDANALQN